MDPRVQHASESSLPGAGQEEQRRSMLRTTVGLRPHARKRTSCIATMSGSRGAAGRWRQARPVRVRPPPRVPGFDGASPGPARVRGFGVSGPQGARVATRSMSDVEILELDAVGIEAGDPAPGRVRRTISASSEIVRTVHGRPLPTISATAAIDPLQVGQCEEVDAAEAGSGAAHRWHPAPAAGRRGPQTQSAQAAAISSRTQAGS